MNEYKHFKDALGLDEDAKLRTWDEIDRLNEVSDDHFIYLGDAVDDDSTGCYAVMIKNAQMYCVLDYPIESNTVLLKINTIEFMNGDCKITFRAKSGVLYKQYLKGGINEEALNDVYKCFSSVSGLAECQVDDHYNVLMWRIFDDDKNRQDD